MMLIVTGGTLVNGGESLNDTDTNANIVDETETETVFIKSEDARPSLIPKITVEEEAEAHHVEVEAESKAEESEGQESKVKESEGQEDVREPVEEDASLPDRQEVIEVDIPEEKEEEDSRKGDSCRENLEEEEPSVEKVEGKVSPEVVDVSKVGADTEGAQVDKVEVAQVDEVEAANVDEVTEDKEDSCRKVSYPVDINPFGDDDDDDDVAEEEEKRLSNDDKDQEVKAATSSTNPFGSDFDDSDEAEDKQVHFFQKSGTLILKEMLGL